MIHMITEPAQTDEAIERRQAPRTAFGGKPVVPVETPLEGEPIMACLMDVSQTGACLLFPPDIEVPHTFKMDWDETSHEAQVVWQKGSVAGVRFTS